ncbi:hypothetical protein [Nocardia sp. NPDC004123]
MGVNAVEDRTDLGEQLGQVDRAHAGQLGQQSGSGVLIDAMFDQGILISDGGLDAAQEPHLGSDHHRQSVDGHG